MNLRCQYSKIHRIAVTGSTGYVGRNLLELFNTPDFVDIEFGSVPTGALVIHLAARIENTRSALADNLLIDSYVLEQVNNKHRGLVYASGNNVYPFTIDCRTFDQLRCNDYYSTAKVFGEKLFEDFIQVPYVAVRISDVFGIGQKHGNFFKALEYSIANQIAITLYGAGLKRRTYIHIMELAQYIKWIAIEGFELSATKRILNVGYNDSASISEIATICANLANVDIFNIEIEPDHSAFDVRTMQSAFLPGYVPRWCSFRSALSDYVKEINSQAKHKK